MGQINTEESIILEVRQCIIKVTSRFFRATIVVVDKTIIITYSECVSAALGIQHAVRMRNIVICALSNCTICFSRYLHRFPKRKLLNTKCVLIFSTPSVRNISHSKKN
jgi:hypothetical protein